MPRIVSCPEPEVLRRLILGHLPVLMTEALARHLEHCGRCPATIETLWLEDTLVEAVRAQKSIGLGVEDKVVARLIERLQHNGPPSPEAKTGDASR